MAVLIKKGNTKFNDANSAMKAMLKAEFYYATTNTSTNSHIHLYAKVIELTVHFTDASKLPKLSWLKYSSKTLESHYYYSDYSKTCFNCRTITFTFEY